MRALYLATLASLVLVCAVGATRLFDPMSGDQALFLLGAMKLHGGGVLYRDFWDIKQPGIFAFFWLGGMLFGFTSIGEHAFDLVWQATFGLAVAAGLWRWVRPWPALAAFAPLAAAGSYFAGSSSWHLLQVEGLAGLPLFCCAWFALEAIRDGKIRLAFAVASGAAAGFAILFKLLFAIVALATVAGIVIAIRPRPAARSLRAACAAWLGGACIPLGAFTLYGLATGTSGDVLSTFFAQPISIARLAPHAPASRLADSALRFVLYFRGLMLLAIIGAVAGRDARSRPWRYASIAWIVASLLIIALQVESWWQYQFLLLVPPLGVLSTFGFASFVRNAMAGRRRTALALAAGAVVCYVSVPLPQGAIGTAIAVAHERPYGSAATLETYREILDPDYAAARRDAAFVTVAARENGTLYVFGNPLVYLFALRAQPIAMSGWALQFYTPELWSRLDRELRAAEPDFVFVQTGVHRKVAAANGGETASLLAANYVTGSIAADGTWYVKRRAFHRRRAVGTTL